MSTPYRHSIALLNLAALQAQLSTTMLPGEILLASGTQAGPTVAFTRGIPASTTQGAAALLSERDLTRALLRDAGHDVADFGVFLLRSDRRPALSWAENAGYPVSASPVWTVKESPHVTDSDELVMQIEAVARLASRRSPGPTHPRARYLVQKIAGARRIELSIAHGEVIARLIDNEPATADDLHADLEELGRSAIHDVPGLSVGRVWFALDDPRHPSAGECKVLDVNPRITFTRLLQRDEAAAHHAATRLLQLEADAQGLHLQSRSTCPDAVLTIGGVALPERAAAQVAQFCRANFPALSVTADSSSEIQVSSTGDAESLGTLQWSLIQGLVPGVRPLHVSIDWLR